MIDMKRGNTPADHRLSGGRTGRESGALLLELALAIPVLLLGVLGFFVAFRSNHRSTQDIITQDFETTTVTVIKELLDSYDFTTLYSTYNNSTFIIGTSSITSQPDISDLSAVTNDTTNQRALVRVRFYIDETALPAEFGPVTDIDGDGVLNTTNAIDYKILPMRLTLYYDSVTEAGVRDIYTILGTRSES